MKVVVLLLLAACACAHEGSNRPQDKPGYEQTEAPDKQVEYVTGPNVGIVGPTVLGGKGQEVQPSGEELQSTDKEQRDVSSLGVVYSGYQELPGQQDVSKGQADAAYAKYAASLHYRGIKYGQSQEPRPPQRKHHKKLQTVKNASRPTTQKAAHYQGEEPEHYTHSQEQYYEPQEQNDQHQSRQSPQNYQQVQNQRQEESRAPENQVKSGTSNTSQESQSRGEGSEGQQAPPPNEAPIYIPQEYLQYQLAPQEEQGGNIQPSLEFPGKHQLQLFLPQEASGVINGHEQTQITAVPRLHPIQSGQSIQYIPTYTTSQPATLQREHQAQHPPVQIIRQPQETVKQPPPFTLHNAYSSGPINPSIYYRAQPHPLLHPAHLHLSQMSSPQQSQSSPAQSPQLHSNFQPSQFQPFSNDQPQYHLQHSNDALRRPHGVNVQQKQSAPTIQLAQKFPDTKSANAFYQPHSYSPSYRQKFTERLPQRQAEHLAHLSQSPLKITQHRQTHNPPTHQSEQVYRTESSQTTDDKPDTPPQVRPYTPKIHTPQHIQNPSTYPVKVVSVQPQIPQTQYELSSDKMAPRPLLYPFPSQSPIAQPTEIPHQSIGLEQIPTEADKLYNVKIPTYIKALEQQSGQSKPFGFAQMSFGDKPGSYSYSIFNKHS